MSLENIVVKPRNPLKEFGKGLVTGAAVAADPLGTFYSGVDYLVHGAGPSDRERALPTVVNKAYQAMYPDFQEPLKMASGYIPRAIGMGVGGAALIVGAYALGGPVGLGALLLGTAAISTIGAGAKTIKNYFQGERIGDTYQKSSIYDGLKYGLNRTLLWDVWNVGQVGEAALTGRGMDTSNFESTAKDSSGAMRRNARGVVGMVGGAVAGVALTIASLGLIPLGYTLYNANRAAKREKKKAKKPRHIRKAAYA
ncbi:hypothetical protein ACFL1B_00500 [Nanoarchaeota archaeon]